LSIDSEVQRIGIYGGSFDPVHLGHQLVAQTALEELSLDRIFFVPAAQSPFKPDQKPTPAPLRAAMLRLALAGKTWAEVDLQEINRGGISYTIDTVQNFRQRFPAADLFWLIGADHVPQLPKWRNAAELGKLITFLVIPRPGDAPVETPAGFRTQWLKGFPLGVSASEIRARVKANLPIDVLTGPLVAEAIRNNRLYF
jgi:nicotinate-nucleotide adenylyltransferase